MVIARNRAISRLRRHNPAAGDELLESTVISTFNIESAASQQQLLGRVKGALESLPAEQRAAVELAYFEGLTPQRNRRAHRRSARHREDAAAFGCRNIEAHFAFAGGVNDMNGHPTREEDFDLLALGALEGDEKLAIESHVASCAAVRAETRRSARTHRHARARRAARRAIRRREAAPDAAGSRRCRSTQREQPAREPRQPERAAGSFGRWWAAVLVPAFAVLAVATILLWTQNRQLDRQLAALRAAAQQQQQQLQQAREVADMIESHDTITVALAQQPGMPTGAAHVMYNAKMGMLMYEGEIAPAPAAKSYQLWLVPAAGKPISAGVFNPVGGRADHWMMKLPQGVEPKMFAVTLEPAGGMPQPTGPMVLVGRA